MKRKGDREEKKNELIGTEILKKKILGDDASPEEETTMTPLTGKRTNGGKGRIKSENGGTSDKLSDQLTNIQPNSMNKERFCQDGR